jgi:hypothetical protein
LYSYPPGAVALSLDGKERHNIIRLCIVDSK